MNKRTEIIAASIRAIPDFPKPGILFRDVTTLIANPAAFAACVDEVCDIISKSGANKILAIESRGFLFGAPAAAKLGLPLLIVRKPGKLPWKTVRETYSLEYGTDTLEIHEDAIAAGDRVAVVDDLLATGGTAAAAGRLISRCQGTCAGYLFVVELDGLGGRARLNDAPVHAIVNF